MLCGCLFLVGESGVQKISVSSHERSADRKRNMLTVDIGLALELCYNKSDSSESKTPTINKSVQR